MTRSVQHCSSTRSIQAAFGLLSEPRRSVKHIKQYRFRSIGVSHPTLHVHSSRVDFWLERVHSTPSPLRTLRLTIPRRFQERHEDNPELTNHTFTAVQQPGSGELICSLCERPASRRSGACARIVVSSPAHPTSCVSRAHIGRDIVRENIIFVMCLFCLSGARQTHPQRPLCGVAPAFTEQV